VDGSPTPVAAEVTRSSLGLPNLRRSILAFRRIPAHGGRLDSVLEVVRMKRGVWLLTATRYATGFGLAGWTAVASGTPHQPPREPSRTFDLAVEEVEVRQLSSTAMFREVEVRCVIANRGPKSATGASIVISRPGDDGRKVLKKIAMPELATGDRFDVRAQSAAWFATPVPYRCEIQFAGNGAGDSDPNDDYGEFTYPRL
jgi:hypothetical protein